MRGGGGLEGVAVTGGAAELEAALASLHIRDLRCHQLIMEINKVRPQLIMEINKVRPQLIMEIIKVRPQLIMEINKVRPQLIMEIKKVRLPFPTF